nr:hypothetical protein [Eubacterium sp.]
MNKAIMTYGKRELKKVIVLPILAVLYIVLLFLLHGILVSGESYAQYVAHGFPGVAGIYGTGDLYFHYLCERIMPDFTWLTAIFFVVFLVQRLFYLENRDGVSDFLRVLPIREREKTLVKLTIGESLILFYALLFGIAGTISYKCVNPSLRFRSEIIMNGSTDTNGLLVLWQMASLMFVTMSAMFLVYYLAQCCIHHRALAFVIGTGVLGVPALISYALNQILSTDASWNDVTFAIVIPYPEADTGAYLESWNTYIEKYVVQWKWYPSAMVFWLCVCVLIGILIAVAVKCRWNIKESSNRLINSGYVCTFIISGVTFCVALSVAMLRTAAMMSGMNLSDVTRSFMIVLFGLWILMFGIAQLVRVLYQMRVKNNR